MLTAHDEMLKRVEEINADPKTRAELEEEFGKVWDTRELAEFILIDIRGKLLRVKRKSDGVELWLGIQERPRLYFGFKRVDALSF